MWDKIVAAFGGNIVDQLGSTVDKFVTTDAEKTKLKQELSQVVMSNLNRMAEAQASVLQTEMKGDFLQRNWRPIVMLVFAFILVMKWFGWTDDSITEALELELMTLLELGIGGYVAGRSVEKIADTVTKNIDLSSLRRKDRKDILRNRAKEE
jgi:hypothetical protein